jgi:putative methyltransferase (TIGR04325 family)
MMAIPKELAKQFLPPILLRSLRRLIGTDSIAFEGNYPSWADAAEACGTAGYAERNIAEKTLQSVLAVKDGQAVFERDSVLFDEIHYSWPLLSAILLAALRSGDQFKILDFGGSLGSTYFQNRKFFSEIGKSLHYGIVEQSHYVDIGNTHIAGSDIAFYKSAGDFHDTVGAPDLVILSGVLQNLEEPFVLMDGVLKLRPSFVCLDRTPFLAQGGERISIQVVPEWIYPAKYPHRFFDETSFVHHFESAGYRILERFDAIDGSNEIAAWKGFIFVKST